MHMDIARSRSSAFRRKKRIRAKYGECSCARMFVDDGARTTCLWTLDEGIGDMPDVDALLGGFGRVCCGCW